MPLRISSKRMADRRNALGRSAHRKSLMQGILSVAGGGGKPPSSELKEGKHLPEYLGEKNKEYEFPECAHKVLKDPDDFYQKKTYVMVNKQGSIFRFSKARSLFLFDPTNRLRSAAADLYIRPMFAHFIMFVIICNCACMVPAEPVWWIENYLEHVFTAIYVIEAAIKIITRGFALHQFSYLRDPWNWLDFIVIMAEVISTSLKAIVSSDHIGGQQVAMLRAFRVLRALKTMSVIPDLRAIVKALLHSIRALKDAVLLTAFVVSVFALVGYQLFHGTLRQKCVQEPGTLELPPNAMFQFVGPRNATAGLPFQDMFRDFRTTNNASSFDSHANFLPVYATLNASALKPDPYCAGMQTFPPPDGVAWSAEDARLLSAILSATNATVSNNTRVPTNYSDCFANGSLTLKAAPLASLLVNASKTHHSNSTNVTIHYDVAALQCVLSVAEGDTKTKLSLGKEWHFNETTAGLDYFQRLLLHWKTTVPNWKYRDQLVAFHLATSSNDVTRSFVYLSERKKLSLELDDEWRNDNSTYCMIEPTTGGFYYVGSPNRPIAEPIYCAIEENDVCPMGYKCMMAGDNPDFGYTSFDHFFLAFLTSFRLVALDAWGRLYYLTLHTIGKTYAIFYVVVVLLGSYYLVNLILAVVYMSYEEQHAAVEVEEMEAKEREADKHEVELDNDVHSILCGNNGEMDSSESDVERAGKPRKGLITTSLTSHETRASIGDASGRESRRRRRMASRRSRMTASRNSVFDDDDTDIRRRSSVMSRKMSSRRRRAPSPSSLQVSSDCCSCSDDGSSHPHHPPQHQHPCQRRSTRRSRHSHRRKKAHPSLSSKTSNPDSKRAPSPQIQLVITAADGESPEVPDGGVTPQPLDAKNLLSVNSALRSQSVVSADTFSDYSCSACESACSCRSDEVRRISADTISNTNLQVPIFQPVRRLSDSSSIGDGTVSQQIVEADVNLPVSDGDVSKSILSVPYSPPSSRREKIRPPNSPPPYHTNHSGRSSVSRHRDTSLERLNLPDVRMTDGKNKWLPASAFTDDRSLPPSTPTSPRDDFGESAAFVNRPSRMYKRKSSMAMESRSRDYLQDSIDYSFFDDEILDASEHNYRRRKPKRQTFVRRLRRFGVLFKENVGMWRCCPDAWVRIQHKIENVVLNPFTDLLITLCIALNTFFMCIEYHPMEEGYATMLERANIFFTVVFTVEMVTKIIGLTPFTYFRERWNVFDAVVVFFSCMELLLQSMNGLSVLRAFRLMRILKLAKQWPVLNKLLGTIGKTVGKLWHLTIVFMLVLFIFALIGMQLLRQDYVDKYQDNQPRWNFVDFPHAVMVVFRIQCGEWVENMFNCLHISSPEICIPLFILVYVIGNLVILNLFLALLLNSFSGQLDSKHEGSSITEAFEHFVEWGRKRRERLSKISINSYCCRLLKLGVRGSPKKIIDSLPAMVEMKNMENGTKSHKIRSSCGDCHANDAAEPKEDDQLITNHMALENGDSGENHENNNKEHHHKSDHRRHHRHHHSHHHKHHHKHHPRSTNGYITRSSDPDDVTVGVTSMSEVELSKKGRDSRQRASSLNITDTGTVHERPLAEGGVIDGQPRRWAKVRRAVSDKEKMQQLKAEIEAEAARKDEENEKAPEEESEDHESKKHQIEPCLPCFPNEPLSRGVWGRIRKVSHAIVVHRHFDNVVIFCILLSSATLALEDVYLETRPAMLRVVRGIDIFCCVFFTVEMVMKWLGYGFKFYFTNPWCILDFLIVLISIMNLTLVSNEHINLSALRVLRTFRALRPLRALSRFEGMKIVVDALIRAVPSIGHVFMVCVMFWLIFSILGVNLFGGQFGRCVAMPTSDILPRRFSDPADSRFVNATLWEQCNPNNTELLRYLSGEIPAQLATKNILPAVTDKKECLQCSQWLNTTDIAWQVPSVNFDSVIRGYLVLMQVATFNGWLEIMESAIDITGKEQQPSYEASFYSYAYFGVFIVFGAFFSLNLFIGVIIDNFNQQKSKSQSGGGGKDAAFLLTDEQQRYYDAMKKMASKTPKKPIPRPQSKFANKIYDIVTSRKFEVAVMAMIMLNLVVMAIEHNNMSKEMSEWLQYFNLGFITIFVIEATLKLIGLRLYYFTVPWNVFDFLVVVISLVATGLNDVMSQYFVQPTLFRIIRLFRVTRILRLIREAKGIRTLLFALMMSLPALFNIGCLLFLFMFIYAIIGMSQFPYVQKIAGIDDMLNFETFPNAFLVLFQVSTSEGWDRFIEPILRDEAPFCDENPADGSPSNCGNATMGVIYFVTYVMITFLIVVNMYIAIILENFVVATRESAEPLTADDFEQFFEVWQRYDDRLSQYITFDQLKQLLHHLDFPLRVPMPNNVFIATSNMRITYDGRVHCLEVIIALIKKVLGDSPELNNLKDDMLQSFMLKCRTKENLETMETMDAADFTILLKATITLQRAFRRKRSRNVPSDDDWSTDRENDDIYSSSQNEDSDDSGGSGGYDDASCDQASDCESEQSNSS
uniref:Sodium channel protein n=1 Tax=Phallusia mammillata TaxID=59560 RepID=A0A6F9DSM5_9ASCI|nr:sodium channel protein type 4 subunit alpha B-like [Phallusia mammillata]